MIYTFFDILCFLLRAIGGVVSIQAARRRKNFGFLLIALWFVLSFGIMAHDRVWEARYNRQLQQAPAPKAAGADTALAVDRKLVWYPIMPAILVAGVWLAGRDEKEDPEQNKTNAADG